MECPRFDGRAAIPALEEAFHERRTAGETERPLNKLPGGKGYPSSERGMADDFTNVYTGKRYSGRNYWEVLSMGSQALLHGHHGHSGFSDPWADDPDWLDFTIGVWAAA